MQPVRAFVAPPPIVEKGFCVKCKAEREIKDGAVKSMPNGTRALKGLCGTCGTKMNKFLRGSQNNGQADPEGLLVDILIERLRTASISGGQVKLIFDPMAERKVSVARSEVAFDLGPPITYEQHSSETQVLQAKIDELSAQVASMASAQAEKEE